MSDARNNIDTLIAQLAEQGYIASSAIAFFAVCGITLVQTATYLTFNFGK